MRSRLSFQVLLVLPLASCVARVDWQEMQTRPASRAEVYDGMARLATSGGYRPNPRDCDRGLGTWMSHWSERTLPLGRPGRCRLRWEVLVDEGSATEGWTVRWLIEQQRVKDLAKSMNPSEDDWSNDGADREGEFLFGERLRRMLGPPEEGKRR